jgi:hypothetical protein
MQFDFSATQKGSRMPTRGAKHFQKAALHSRPDPFKQSAIALNFQYLVARVSFDREKIVEPQGPIPMNQRDSANLWERKVSPTIGGNRSSFHRIGGLSFQGEFKHFPPLEFQRGENDALLSG